jgi:hypothetical protein
VARKTQPVQPRTGPARSLSSSTPEYVWQNESQVPAADFDCGYCSLHVAGATGWQKSAVGGGVVGVVRLCPKCRNPNFFWEGKQMPAVAFGKPVSHLPDKIDALYTEARNCMAVNAYTLAVMAGRALLGHIGVSLGAKPNQTFQFYVNYLVAEGHVGAKSKNLVEHVRSKGNETQHDLAIMTREDAELVLRFVEWILLSVYEYPASTPPEVRKE